MLRTTTLLALALVGLSLPARAQNLQTLPEPGLPVAPAPARPSTLATAVQLTRHGIHRSPEATLVRGLEVIDRQRVDVDGDGDQDELLLVDLAESEDEAPERLGRGVVVAFRQGQGWRGQTVASVPTYPMEAGYNWGPIESLAAGATPLLHVLFSQAGPAGEQQADTIVRFERGALRPVYANAVVSSAGNSPDAVRRTLDVQAADVDNDGTSELLERVGVSEHCPASGCATPDGMFAPVVNRRSYRWDESSGRFVEAPDLLHYQLDAVRIMNEALLRVRANDSAARERAMERAYAADPLEPRARIEEARRLVRSGEYGPALEVLRFAWPEGFGRDALSLRAQAAAYGSAPYCFAYLSAAREGGVDRDFLARLASLSPACRIPGR